MVWSARKHSGLVFRVTLVSFFFFSLDSGYRPLLIKYCANRSSSSCLKGYQTSTSNTWQIFEGSCFLKRLLKCKRHVVGKRKRQTKKRQQRTTPRSPGAKAKQQPSHIPLRRALLSTSSADPPAHTLRYPAPNNQPALCPLARRPLQLIRPADDSRGHDNATSEQTRRPPCCHPSSRSHPVLQ